MTPWMPGPSVGVASQLHQPGAPRANVLRLRMREDLPISSPLAAAHLAAYVGNAQIHGTFLAHPPSFLKLLDENIIEIQ